MCTHANVSYVAKLDLLVASCLQHPRCFHCCHESNSKHNRIHNYLEENKPYQIHVYLTVFHNNDISSNHCSFLDFFFLPVCPAGDFFVLEFVPALEVALPGGELHLMVNSMNKARLMKCTGIHTRQIISSM